MARQTRAERRARRQQQAASTEPAIAGAGAGAGKPAPAPSRPDDQQRRPRGGFIRFLAECWGELKKVEWPTQNQVIQGTVVVLIACLVVGTYLYINDQVWKQVVSKLLLGQ